MELPRVGERCRPVRVPSTTERASTAMVPIFASTRGSSPGRAWMALVSGIRLSLGRHVLQEILDDPAGVDPLRFGLEVGDDAVAEDGPGQGPHVFHRDREPA